MFAKNMQSFALLSMSALAAAQSSSSALISAPGPVSLASTTTNVGPPSVTTPTLITATGNPDEGKFSCPMPNANYCYGGPIIIQCDASGLGTSTNCNDMLAAEQMGGGENAICYDAMPGDGKAACALNGTAYASSSTYTISTSAPATTTTAQPYTHTVTTPTLITATGSPDNGKFSCPMANANYCYGGPIIIECDASGLGSSTNCNDMLAAEQMSGGENAICYDAMPGDGKAACALNGTVYASTSTYLISNSASPTTETVPTTLTTTVDCSTSQTTLTTTIDCSSSSSPAISVPGPSLVTSSSSPAISVPGPSLVSSSSSIYITGPTAPIGTSPPSSTSILQGGATSNQMGAGLAAAVGILAFAL